MMDRFWRRREMIGQSACGERRESRTGVSPAPLLAGTTSGKYGNTAAPAADWCAVAPNIWKLGRPFGVSQPAQRPTARAHLAAPGAGALPKSTPSFHLLLRFVPHPIFR